jgi:hypothetical protein
MRIRKLSDPGSGDGKNSDTGSGIKIPVPQHCDQQEKYGKIGVEPVSYFAGRGSHNVPAAAAAAAHVAGPLRVGRDILDIRHLLKSNNKYLRYKKDITEKHQDAAEHNLVYVFGLSSSPLPINSISDPDSLSPDPDPAF